MVRWARKAGQAGWESGGSGRKNWGGPLLRRHKPRRGYGAKIPKKENPRPVETNRELPIEYYNKYSNTSQRSAVNRINRNLIFTTSNNT
jgi:hypothetical protein